MSNTSNFEKLLEAGQDNAMVRYTLGTLAFKQGNYSRAVEHLSKAVEFESGYSAAWKMLARALLETEAWSAAEQALQKGMFAAKAKGDQQVVRELEVLVKRLAKTKR